MIQKSILFTLLLSVPGAVLAQEDAELARTLEAKEKELAALTKEVTEINRRAQGTEFVKAKLERFRDAVTEAMLREAPELEDAIRRQEVLVQELTRAELGERTRAQKMEEYRELRAQIEPVEKSVNDEESVQQARQTYIEAVDSERERINSNAKEMFDRHRELTAEVKELKAQLGKS